MNESKLIENFVSDLMDFKPDRSFNVIKKVIPIQNRLKLAASSDGTAMSTLQKLGTITCPEKDLIIRISKDKKQHCYQLHLVHNNDRSIEYTILTTLDTFKFYIADSDGLVIIPDSAGIDPLQDRLNITFPQAIFKFQLPKDGPSATDIINSENGLTLRSEFQKGDHSLTFFRDTSKNSVICSKLLLISFKQKGSTKVTRLSPLRNGSAKVRIPDSIRDNLNVCLYR